jgi:hypothetical protein
MQLHISPTIPDGDLPVHTNPGGSKPFAIIGFGDADINGNAEDFDRLIRAAITAKAMLAARDTAHDFVPGAGKHGGHCAVCGELNDEDHPKAVVAGLRAAKAVTA